MKICDIDIKCFSHSRSGREPKAETPQFVRELLSIAKGFFFSPLISAKRIGALYLLYSIYFKQNTKWDFFA